MRTWRGILFGIFIPDEIGHYREIAMEFASWGEANRYARSRGGVVTRVIRP